MLFNGGNSTCKFKYYYLTPIIFYFSPAVDFKNESFVFIIDCLTGSIYCVNRCIVALHFSVMTSRLDCWFYTSKSKLPLFSEVSTVSTVKVELCFVV
jgi:hypothetical protein